MEEGPFLTVLLTEAHQSAQGGPMSPPQHGIPPTPRGTQPGCKSNCRSYSSLLDDIFHTFRGLSCTSTLAKKEVQMGHHPARSRATPVQATSHHLCCTWALRDGGGHITGCGLCSAAGWRQWKRSHKDASHNSSHPILF